LFGKCGELIIQHPEFFFILAGAVGGILIFLKKLGFVKFGRFNSNGKTMPYPGTSPLKGCPDPACKEDLLGGIFKIRDNINTMMQRLVVNENDTKNILKQMDYNYKQIARMTEDVAYIRGKVGDKKNG